MADNNIIIRNVKVVTPTGDSARRGSSMSELSVTGDASIVITDGIITYVGPSDDIRIIADVDYNILEGDGNVALPGFVDSHTHLIFGGFRPDEFEWRLKGDSYMSIMERGGGIQSTVNATREESLDALVEKARWFVDRMVEMGVTTVEAKSGYGLDTESEIKMLDAIDTIARDENTPLSVVATFLGAHAVPREYKGRTPEYIDLMIREMLPAVKGKAEFCDIFTEKNVFEIEDSRRFLTAAREAGFKLKLHADEIVTLGGAELAAEMGAVSADHLLHVSDEGVRRMAEKDSGDTASAHGLCPEGTLRSRKEIYRRGCGSGACHRPQPRQLFLRLDTSYHRACLHIYEHVGRGDNHGSYAQRRGGSRHGRRYRLSRSRQEGRRGSS